jgi:tetratricopeptide (TPR) repeat protein
MKTRVIFFFCILSLFTACKGPKYYTKLGVKQEASGLSAEASESYFSALRQKRNYVEAQAGMKRTGQIVLNQKLVDFGRKKTMNTPREAVYAFVDAQEYQQKIAGIGVTLEIGEMYQNDFDEIKKTYINELYEKGTSQLEQEQFKEAEINFKEISKFNPNFKDAKDLQDIAYLEPLYKDGKAMFEAGRYRTAYESLSKVVEKRSNYKDASSLKSKSLEKGTVTIALLPFTNGTKSSGAEVGLSAYTLAALTSIKDPFLRIVDRENMMTILQEQKLQLSGIVDDKTAVEVGKIVGAQIILTGSILKLDEKKGNVVRERRTAFQAFQEKQVSNGQTIMVTKYRPIEFDYYYGKSYSAIDAQMKLISLQTGELLKTALINKKAEDEVYYARSDFNKETLYPNEGGNVQTAHDKVQGFRNLFTIQRDLKSTEELSSDAYKQATAEMAQQVKTLMLELVK